MVTVHDHRPHDPLATDLDDGLKRLKLAAMRRPYSWMPRPRLGGHWFADAGSRSCVVLTGPEEP